MKGLWIRSDERIIEEVTYADLADMQRMVGGYIGPAHRFDNQDVVFVDREGVQKRYPEVFILHGAYQPFCGNGLLVGRERGGASKTFDPRTTKAQLERLIRFCTTADLQHTAGTA